MTRDALALDVRCLRGPRSEALLVAVLVPQPEKCLARSGRRGRASEMPGRFRLRASEKDCGFFHARGRRCLRQNILRQRPTPYASGRSDAVFLSMSRHHSKDLSVIVNTYPYYGVYTLQVVSPQSLSALTVEPCTEKIGPVPRRQIVDPAFGKWLGYLRDLTDLSQRSAASEANVSVDSVRRLENGELTGSAHLLAWLSWLNSRQEPDLRQQLAEWPTRLLSLGERARREGLASKPAKAKRKQTGEAIVPTKKRRHAGR